MSMDQVEFITLTEDNLFELDDFVDNLQAQNHKFRYDGVTLFSINSEAGTRLPDFISKYKDEVMESLNRLNPICVPQSEGCYGHYSTSSNYLTAKEVSICDSVLDDPLNYSVSSDNCCISALSEGGTEGLLSHYFDKILPAEASNPPQLKHSTRVYKADRKSLNKHRILLSNKTALKSKISPIEKKKFMLKALSQEKKKEENQFLCHCWMCMYSDEVLHEEKNEVTPMIAETAKYYQGKGFLYANGLNVNSAECNMISSNFSLSFVQNSTMIKLLDGIYPGLHSPYLYFGFDHSFFPVHYEDLSLFSLSFLHHGSPKAWVVIPPSSVSKLHYFLSKEFTCPGHGSCLNSLGHKYHIPTPSWLKKRGIPYKVVVQRAGQGVIVAPNAAHFGFNMQGANISESINFATRSWVPYGIVYPKCSCMPGQVHADLSAIIACYCPELMEAYKQRKIPVVPLQPDFVKCIIHPYLWTESFEMNVEGMQEINVEGEDSVSQIGEEEAANLPPKKKKRPNRKVIICPVCDKTFSGGQKARLQNHLTSNHANLSVEEDERVKAAIAHMFPERGSKLPKKKCTLCGKFVARAMQAHQNSDGCIPKIVNV